MKNKASWLALSALVLWLGSACGSGASDPDSAPRGPGAATSEEGVDSALLAEIEAIVSDPEIYSRACRLADVLRPLEADSIPTVRRALRRAFVSDMGAGEYELLVHWWSTQDARQAARWSIARARSADQEAALRASVRAWARSEPRDALARVGRMRGGLAKAVALGEVIAGWYESGEPGLVAAIDSLGSGKPRQHALAAYVTVLVEEGGTAAPAEWADSLPAATAAEKAFQEDITHAVLGQLASKDLEAATLFCAEHCDEATRHRLAAHAESVASGRADEPDFDAARLAELEAITGDPDFYARTCRMSALLQTADPSLVPTVRWALDPASDLALAAGEYELLVYWWAAQEPAAAATWSIGNARTGGRVHAVRHSVRAWARSAPRDAMARVARAGTGDVGPIARQELVRGWYESGEPGLDEYIRNLGMGMELQRALDAYAEALVVSDGAKAVTSWIASLPQESRAEQAYKMDALRAAGGALAIHDIEAARHFCDEHCDGELQGRHGLGLRARIATRWVEREGPAAMAWLASQPDTKEKNLAASSAYSAWGSIHRSEAIAWMREQLLSVEGEPEGWLRRVYLEYTRLVAFDDGARAIELTEVMEGRNHRARAQVEVAKVWRRMDPEAAEAWLQESPLSEDEREAARRIPRKHLRGHDFID